MFEILDEDCTPQRGTKYSAYVDLFARENVTIGAGATKIVPLGIKIDLEKLRKKVFKHLDASVSYFPIKKQDEIFDSWLKSHYLEVALRSSLGIKGLIIVNGIGVIDLDFADEIGLIVHNPFTERTAREAAMKQINQANGGDLNKYIFNEGYFIKKGQKVAQCTLKEHKGYLMGYESDVVRDGGFGSTDI